MHTGSICFVSRCACCVDEAQNKAVRCKVTFGVVLSVGSRPIHTGRGVNGCQNAQTPSENVDACPMPRKEGKGDMGKRGGGYCIEGEEHHGACCSTKIGLFSSSSKNDGVGFSNVPQRARRIGVKRSSDSRVSSLSVGDFFKEGDVLSLLPVLLALSCTTFPPEKLKPENLTKPGGKLLKNLLSEANCWYF